MSFPPINLEVLDEQGWTLCYQYLGSRLLFMLKAWTEHMKRLDDQSSKIPPVVFGRFTWRILSEVAWASSVGMIACRKGAHLEYTAHNGCLVAEVTRLMLDTDWCTNTTDLQTFLQWWKSRDSKRRVQFNLWWDQLPEINTKERLLTLEDVVALLNKERADGQMKYQDEDWRMLFPLGHDMEAIKRLQKAHFWSEQAVAVTQERMSQVRERLQELIAEFREMGAPVPFQVGDAWVSSSALSED